jgi:hypothetical protein
MNYRQEKMNEIRIAASNLFSILKSTNNER